MLNLDRLGERVFAWDKFIHEFLPSLLELDAWILVYDDRRLLAASPSARSGLGFNGQDLETMDRLLWSDPAERERFEAHLDTICRGVKAENADYLVRTADGESFSTRIQFGRFQVENKPRICLCLLLNEPVHLDAPPSPELWSDELWKAIVDNSLVGLVLVNDKMKPLYANAAAQRIYGASSWEEMKEFQIFSTLHPDSIKLVVERFKNWMEGKPNDPEVVYKIVCPDGTTRSVLSRTHDTLDLPGMKCHLMSMVDITGRVETEEALRRSERMYRLLAENASDMIWAAAPGGDFTFVSPASQKLLGYRPEEVLEVGWRGLLPPDLGLVVFDTFHQALADGRHELSFEVKLRARDGSLVWTETQMRLLYDEQGGLSEVQGVSRDITQRRAMEERLREALHKEVEQVRSPGFFGGDEAEPSGLDYPSAAMKEVRREAAMAAAGDGNLLILGDSGVGKSHLARWVHQNSDRRDGPFLAVNCASLAPSLIESELFGHEAGAFTGSQGRKRGLIELAAGGTLLLDEIGDLEPGLQGKLLQFLDTRSIRRLGGETILKVDTRIIAATNQDLEALVHERHFREDLFYRLNVLSIRVPPLRDRMEDLPLVAAEILRRLARDMGLAAAPLLGPPALQALMKHGWPGNLRELRNVLERAVLISPDKTIIADPNTLRLEAGPGNGMSLTEEGSFKERVENYERKIIGQALASFKTKREAAQFLGLSRHALDRKIRSLGIGPNRSDEVGDDA